MTSNPAATFGWRWMGWKGRKIGCVRCNRRVRYGLVNIHNNNPDHPAFRVMCEGCAELTMQEKPPPEWGTPAWGAK